MQAGVLGREMLMTLDPYAGGAFTVLWPAPIICTLSFSLPRTDISVTSVHQNWRL